MFFGVLWGPKRNPLQINGWQVYCVAPVAIALGRGNPWVPNPFPFGAKGNPLQINGWQVYYVAPDAIALGRVIPWEGIKGFLLSAC